MRLPKEHQFPIASGGNVDTERALIESWIHLMEIDEFYSESQLLFFIDLALAFHLKYPPAGEGKNG